MSGSGLLAGILIGGTLGFVAGMLLAPKSGGEMRSVLAERGQELRDKADELAAAARERIASATSEGRRAARRMRGESSPFDEMNLDNEDL
jgi:gas vesicle protein